MATVRGNISDTAIDIRSGLVDADGNAAPLTSGSSYTVQNVGQSAVFFSENAAAPSSLDGPWHLMLANGGDWEIEVAGIAIWARTHDGQQSRITVTVA